MSNDDLTDIYNAIDPFQPLQPGDPAYVDCREVRGDANVLVDLGREILRSHRVTCQLYAGHRGAGKSTELLRLKADLETKGCFVVYFAAVGDDRDIAPDDVQYTDILLGCTQHLLEGLKTADPKPLLGWLGDRWQALKDFAQSEIEFEKLDIGAQIQQFAHLNTTIRAVPSLRKKIRDQIEPYTVTLLKALNEFIADGERKLPAYQTKLVVIADNLDRIVPIRDDDGRSNHDEIFLDRSEQLKGLHCHLIYTVPISMVYSNRANDLKDTYGNPQLLPMIMVQTEEGRLYPPGFSKVKELIASRIKPFAPQAELETDIFENPEVLERLCLASGGHVRELLLLAKEAINRTDTLPISARAVRRAITETRDTYRRTVEKDQWLTLAKVAQFHNIENDEQHRNLLFRRCLLEYRYFDDQGDMQCWYDVHPLIKGIQEFKEAVVQFQP
ncbi:MAG: ATP-binding protein [Leptolyngbyaceae cyanobacterium RM2_2_4]|nr:ATP-binding protein [Leptolyngbyaceae cyanobacterium SM1_4_3]NJN91018.1 ATP-binding protein [Leptolyngbyaceae cyanobacterium SL_5_14]NJO49287.1 ATP-binding protein [Leptolyngbyaceae cyanobacterium RM2_2_4]